MTQPTAQLHAPPFPHPPRPSMHAGFAAVCRLLRHLQSPASPHSAALPAPHPVAGPLRGVLFWEWDSANSRPRDGNSSVVRDSDSTMTVRGLGYRE